MHDAPLSGTLPVSWAGNNSFAVLSELQLGCDTPGAGQLSGKLPSERGTPTSFVSLQTLYISGAAITGDVCICSLHIGNSNRYTVHPSSACICKLHCKKGKQQLQTRLGSKVHLGCDTLALDKVHVVAWVPCTAVQYCVQYWLTVSTSERCDHCAGSIPADWTLPGAFPALSKLELINFPLSGILSATLGSSWPALVGLQLGADTSGICGLSGILPTEWGSASAFQQLARLWIANCSITGLLLGPECDQALNVNNSMWFSANTKHCTCSKQHCMMSQDACKKLSGLDTMLCDTCLCRLTKQQRPCMHSQA